MTARDGIDMGTIAPMNVVPLTHVGAVQYMLTFAQIAFGLKGNAMIHEATQNVAKSFSVLMRDAASGLGAALASTTGIVVQIKKGGLTTYATITPTLTIVGTTGLLNLALTAAHLDTLGVAAVNVTGPGLLPNDDLFVDVIAVNKNDAVRGGMTALPNVAAAASGGLPTLGGAIPNALAGASGGLPLQGAAIPNANAGSINGLPTLGGAIPNVVAGNNGGLPTIGGTIPNASAGANGGLPTIGGTIPNATAGTSSGLSTKQNVDDAASGVNTHTDVEAAAVISAVNAHTDSVVGGGGTFPTAAEIRDAILDELLSSHTTVGSVADGVAIAAGLLQGNFMMDNVVNTDPNGQTAARIRVWRSAGAMSGATAGGSGAQGAFASFDVSTTYSGVGKVTMHKTTRTL